MMSIESAIEKDLHRQKGGKYVTTSESDSAIISLFERIARGDREAEDMAVRGYLPLVRRICRQTGIQNLAGIDEEDKEAAGSFGLFKAVRSFDLAREIRFPAYAPIKIRGSIRDDNRGANLIPREMIEVLTDVRAYARERLGGVALREVTTRDLEVVLPAIGITGRRRVNPNAVMSAICLQEYGVWSIERWENEDDKNSDNHTKNGRDTLYDPTPDHTEIAAVREEVRARLSRLSGDELELVIRYFGLGGRKDETLQEIGKTLRLSESRMCQRLKNVKRKLRVVANQ